MRLILLLVVALVIIGGISVATGRVGNPSQRAPQASSNPSEPTAYADKSSLQLKSYYPDGFSPTGGTCEDGKIAYYLVLDNSSSMSAENGGRLAKLKSSVKNFAKSFNNESIVGVRRFSTESALIVNIDKYNQTNFVTAVDKLRAQGGTHMKLAMTKAKEDILAAKPKYPDLAWKLLFISDGAPNPDDQDPRAVAKEIKASGIDIISIGLDLDSLPNPEDEPKAKAIIKEIASSPDLSFLPTSDTLEEVLAKLGQKICPTNAAVPRPTPNCTATTKPKINLLVDTSGSMDDNIPTVRDVLKNFGNKLNSSDTIGLQDFSDGKPPRSSAARVKYPIGNYNQAQFNSAVGSLPADNNNGWTHMKDGFNLAKAEIEKNDSTLDDWLLIFLSDGKPETEDTNETSDPSQDPRDVVNELKGKQLKIASIALGGADKGLMRQIASSPNLYKEVSTVADLQKAYDEIFQTQVCTPGS